MSDTRKRRLQEQLARTVFARDGYRCLVCGFESSAERADHELVVHLITPYHLMPNEGRVAENAATLCDPSRGGGRVGRSCRYIAEQILLSMTQYGREPQHEHDAFFEYSPKALYAKIGSSREAAIEASEYLR